MFSFSGIAGYFEKLSKRVSFFETTPFKIRNCRSSSFFLISNERRLKLSSTSIKYKHKNENNLLISILQGWHKIEISGRSQARLNWSGNRGYNQEILLRALTAGSAFFIFPKTSAYLTPLSTLTIIADCRGKQSTFLPRPVFDLLSNLRTLVKNQGFSLKHGEPQYPWCQSFLAAEKSKPDKNY